MQQVTRAAIFIAVAVAAAIVVYARRDRRVEALPPTKQVTRAALFIAVVVAGLIALFAWRDYRMETLLPTIRKGDVIRVESDICDELKKQGFVSPDQFCPRTNSVRVQIIRTPEPAQ